MSRRLPLCAHCGKPLAGCKNRLMVEAVVVPGKPRFGWHFDGAPGMADCYHADAMSRQVFPARAANGLLTSGPLMDLREVAHEIAARGAGRVVAGKRWRHDA